MSKLVMFVGDTYKQLSKKGVLVMGKNLIKSQTVNGLLPTREVKPSSIKIVVGAPRRMRVGELVTPEILRLAEIRYKQRQAARVTARKANRG
jgi:hypothetical protein